MAGFAEGTQPVRLIGLDFGSTTTSVLIVEARVDGCSAGGRIGLNAPRILLRTEPCFTPFVENEIDAEAVARLIDSALAEAALGPEDLFAGGAMLTGLAARSRNAEAIAALVRDRIGEAVIATADDPRLESWLAFMGSCAALSRARPGQVVVNLDIGGGTTNAAAGRDGTVFATGCHLIGARHLRFEPGTYRLVGWSEHGRVLLEQLRIMGVLGDELDAASRDRLLSLFVDAMEALVGGGEGYFAGGAGQLLEEAALALPSPADIVTFSGGVGELVYRLAAGEEVPSTTAFGDLGIDLARAIVASPILSRSLGTDVPEQRGRATVYGLTLHTAEISGRTSFLPGPGHLPLRDLPVVGRLDAEADASEFTCLFGLALRHRSGASVQLEFSGPPPDLEGVKRIGAAIRAGLEASAYPPDRPLVLIVPINIGKALGNYATDWGRHESCLVVVDEIPLRHADFISLGRPRGTLVPIAFYGMH